MNFLQMSLDGRLVRGHDHPAGGGLTPEAALESLKAGNTRFVTGRAEHPHSDRSRLSHLHQKGQAPLAAVLSCSDSRVPVELLFDQGFGDVFVIRAAGQVAGVDQAGSVEYAVDHLGVPLVLVLGHTDCGAVKAAVSGEKATGVLGQLLARLDPVVDQVRDLPAEARVAAAIEKNVDWIIKELRDNCPGLAAAEKAGRVRLTGAIYHLDSGKVEFRN